MLRCSFVLVLICLGLSAQVKAAGLVLINSQVPIGRELARQYGELHEIKNLRVVEVSVEPLETISLATYKKDVEAPLRAAIGEDWPDWILTIYGMPLMVQGKSRLRCLDQCLVTMRLERDLGDKLALSPLFFREHSDSFSPLPVCRLDGPALRHVEVILESWAQLKHWGGWRRCFPLSENIGLSLRLASAGHAVYTSQDFAKVRLEEVQLLEGKDADLQQWLGPRTASEQFAPGALVFRHHNQADSDLPFRGNKGSASMAISLGAAFYVGPMNPQSSEEDLFDPELFVSLYLKGKTFWESAYAAVPVLGGTLLICGDPLAEPYSEAWANIQNESFMASKVKADDPMFTQKLSVARDWWLLRDYVRYWEQARFEMVVQLLKIAILQREDSLYLEWLARSYEQLGRKKDLDELWKKWPDAKKGPWEQYLWGRYWSVIPEE